MKLTELIKQGHFASIGQEAMLNIMVTSSWMLGELAASMAPYGVTPSQYNVLRVLRGSHPKLLTCSDIRNRLLDRTPDVTRLLNRLEKRGYVHRARATTDRRIVEVGISETGRALLSQMDGLMDATVDRMTAHLSDAEQRQVCQLLERLRAPQSE